MPSWKDVLDKVERFPNPLTSVRREYLQLMNKYTERNIIAYYSAFLQKKEVQRTSIDDNDKNAFMQAIYGLDKSKGLDLILHTPGGNLAATESIVNYLKSMFNNDIRVFIPQIAMSAGTMIALASKEIIMGKQSNLGPIDPQYGGVSCAGIIEEFKKACDEVNQNPNLAKVWGLIIGKYHPTFIGDCQKAVEWADVMVRAWLGENMFKGLKNKKRKIDKVLSFLSSHSETYSHQKHIHMDKLVELGLKVTALEKLDSREIDGCHDLQDCVLTLHHAYMLTLANTNIVKMVENHCCQGLATTVSIKKER